MFGSGIRFRRTKGTNFTNAGRDTYQLVVNNSTDARTRGEGDENREPDPIDTLQSNLPPLLEEIRRFQSRAEDMEATGTDDSSALSLPMTGASVVAVNEIVPSDTSSLPRPTSIADKYTRTMLKCLAGYPLYKPKPYNKSATIYLREGIRVGDVGFIRENGAFDFLFNTCPSQNDSINPPNLPNGFTLLESEDLGINDEEEFAHKTRRFYSPVYRTKGFFGCTKYACSESEGAILELPEGATRFEATRRLPFKDLATRYGVEWYRYAMEQGRDIANGSLYLVTSSTKCTHWGIAVVERPCPLREGLQFIRNKCRFRDRTPKYYWKGSSAFITTVAPNQAPHYGPGNDLNQCIFLRGYKIRLREDIWNVVNEERLRGSIYMTMPSLSSHQTGNMTRQGEPSNQGRLRQREIDSGSGLRTTELATDADGPSGGPINPDSPHMAPPSDEVILHADFNSSPVHPSDLINAALLSRESGAKIAITHDDAWCDLLKDILNPRPLDLTKIAWSYTSSIDKYGCISFEKASDSRSCSEVESLLLQRTGSPTPKGLIRQQEHGTSYKDHNHDTLPMFQMPPITSPIVPEVNKEISPGREIESTALQESVQYRFPTKASEDHTRLPTPQISGANLGDIGESATSISIVIPADSMSSFQGIKSTVLQEPASTQSENRLWLNNYVGRHHLGELMYEDHDQLFPGNKHMWTSTVQLNGTSYGQGGAGTKGEARERAAEKALAALKAQFGVAPDEHYD